ncbi:ribosomal protein S21 [Kwoniella dendrophila CBS 6074]|uniref:Ribosomal protein S21 n=1 Tax=Kwoniella dendrophila CBS 6074 TaxID=1295534 RepID=A0AAX4JYT5_9TREE
MAFLFRTTLRATASSSKSVLPSFININTSIRLNSTLPNTSESSSSSPSSSSNAPSTPPTSGQLFSNLSGTTGKRDLREGFSKLRFDPLINSSSLSQDNDEGDKIYGSNSNNNSSERENWWIKASRTSQDLGGYPTNQSTGRSILVTKNGEFLTAYKRLQGLLRQSNLKKELRLQEFHEKPSVKKRRLLSERHRRRFKEMVRAKVQQVVSMRNRG